MSPVVGWLKDRMGTRDPTVFGFVLLVPLICLLGVPGNDSFPWFNVGNRGSITYVVVMASVGLISSFLNGSGTIEAAGGLNSPFLHFSRVLRGDVDIFLSGC